MAQNNTVLQRHQKIMALGQLVAKKLGPNSLDNLSVQELWEKLVEKIQADVPQAVAESTDKAAIQKEVRGQVFKQIRTVSESFGFEVETQGRKLSECLTQLVHCGMAIGAGPGIEEDPEPEEEIEPDPVEAEEDFATTAERLANKRGPGDLKLDSFPTIQRKIEMRASNMPALADQVHPNDLGGKSLSNKSAYGKVATETAKKQQAAVDTMSEDLGFAFDDLFRK